MTRRDDLVLSGLVFEALALLALVFLLACQVRGFDDRMCRAYSACDWRNA